MQQASSVTGFTFIEGGTHFGYLWCVLAHCPAEYFNSLPLFQSNIPKCIAIFLCLQMVCQEEYAILQDSVC
jgi:hypothetical protein